MAKKKSTTTRKRPRKTKTTKKEIKKISKKSLFALIGIIVFIVGSISLVAFNRQYHQSIIGTTESIINTIRGNNNPGQADISGLRQAEERMLTQQEQETVLEKLEKLSNDVQRRSKELFSALLSLSGFFIAISTIIENIKKLFKKAIGSGSEEEPIDTTE